MEGFKVLEKFNLDRKMLQKLCPAIALTVFMSLGIVGKVFAASLSESVDVGEFLFNAGQTNTQSAGTSLDNISGSINFGADIDLYQIFIPIGSFSATTVGSTGINSQLFLFNSGGIGVAANNDAFPNIQATLSTSIPTAGIYYLAISTEGFNPESAGGNPIFTIDPVTGGVADPFTLANPGGSSPLISWSTGSFLETGSYSIAVSGAQFVGSTATAAVPFNFNPMAGVVILGIWEALISGWEYLKKRRNNR